MSARSIEYMLEREAVANMPKHWVRAVTACNSRCVFCLDSDTPRGVYLPVDEVKAEIDRGRSLGAEKLILSGGEASLHPSFTDFISHAKERGYRRVQTVTNGFRFRERSFYDACVRAGLGEITFSLHGHTKELHDRLTRTENAFDSLVKGMVRAVRDGRVIVNVDVVINKQNVAYLDKIVELCLSLGVREFDLLHVIPQAAAFENREELFYDVREHLPLLQKVFRLTRHPGVTVWTNRFPVEYLEGLEDLIQDPHKMLDEVNGRRFHVRRYLDLGVPLECRQKERCEHCFIEPFCTTMDRVIAAQNTGGFDVYWVGAAPHDGSALPFGCASLGVKVESFSELAGVARPEGAGLYVRCGSAEPLPELEPGVAARFSAETAEQLGAWLPSLPEAATLEVELNRSTAPWLLEHRAQVAQALERIELSQPTHEHMKDAHENDVRAPADFFRALDLPGVRVAGLPPCVTPGGITVEPVSRLDAALFDGGTGRVDIHALARHHVSERYYAKSVRCRDCRVNDRCEGLHINMIRDQGLGMLTPLSDGEEAERVERRMLELYPSPRPRLAHGSPAVPAAQSLPGFAQPTEAAKDPLALIEEHRLLRKQQRAQSPVPT